MLEKVKNKVGNILEKYDAQITRVYVEEENHNKYLRVEISRQEKIDSGTIYKIGELISPLIDEMDLIKDSYILDIYGKGEENE